MTPLAQRIQDLLRERGLSARDASLRAGQSKGWVQTILDGDSKRPTAERLSALATVLGVRVEWLMSGTGGRDAAEAQDDVADPLEEALAGEWWGDRLPPPRLAAELARDARAERNLAGREGRQGAAYWRAWLREELQRRMRPEKAIGGTVVADAGTDNPLDDLGPARPRSTRGRR